MYASIVAASNVIKRDRQNAASTGGLDPNPRTLISSGAGKINPNISAQPSICCADAYIVLPLAVSPALHTTKFLMAL